MNIVKKMKIKFTLKIILFLQLFALLLFPIFFSPDFVERAFTHHILFFKYFYFTLILLFITTYMLFNSFFKFDRKEIKNIYYLMMLFYMPALFISDAVMNIYLMPPLPLLLKIIYISCSIFLILFFSIFSFLGVTSVHSKGSKFKYLYDFIEKFYIKLEKLSISVPKKSRKIKRLEQN